MKRVVRNTLFLLITYAVIATVVISSTAVANTEAVAVLQNESGSRWAVGLSMTYHLVNIYMVQASYSVRQNAELLFGLAFQNWTNDQGQAHGYTILLGYRHYLWKGLHAEAEVWPAYNPFKSSIDGQTYTGVELWTSLRLGYTFNFTLLNRTFFLHPQPSIGFAVFRQNPWPDIKKGDNLIFEPQLIVGVRL